MKKNYLYATRLSFVAVLQLILWIAFGFSVYYLNESFKIYGWKYITDASLVFPDSEQAKGIIMSLIICGLITTTAYSIYWSINLIKLSKVFIFTGGLFVFIFIPYIIYICFENWYYQEYIVFLKRKRYEGLQIDNSSFIQTLKKEKKPNQLFWNTLFSYFLLIIFLIGFIMIFIPGQNNTKSYGVYIATSILPYFTNLSTIVCFLFLIYFIFYNRRDCFKENTILILVTSYISMVGFLYWVFIFPDMILDGNAPKGFSLVRSIWLHAIGPTLFIIFTINSFRQNYENPMRSFWKLVSYGVVYPVSYGIYMYTIPFLSRFTVYSTLSNLNPYMQELPTLSKGNPLMIFAVLGIALAFIILFAIFWGTNFLMCRRYNLKENRVAFYKEKKCLS